MAILSQHIKTPNTAKNHQRNHSQQEQEENSSLEAFRLTLFRTMIEAAKATASLDDEMHFHISREIKNSSYDPATKDQLLTMLENPASLHMPVGQTQTIQQRVELYLAARLGVHPQKAKNSLYLHVLKQRLFLDDATIEQVQSTLFGDRSI